MRCLLVLFTVVVFSIVPLAETQLTVIAQEATPTGAQEPTGDMFQIITTDYAPWEQVSRPRPVPQELPVGGDGTTPIVALQQYEIYFGLEFAAVPVVEDAEFMLVAVQEGTFALDLAPPPSPNKPDS